MPLYYVRTFAPWILLAVVSGWSARAGAVTGLVAVAALLTQDLLRGRRADSLILEVSTAFFMASLTALAFTAPGSVLLHYGASLAIAWLALTAWGTVLAGRPFTEAIARRDVPADIAATDLFRQITRTIAIVWSTAFTVMAVILGGIQHAVPGGTLLLIAVKICGFTLPAVFTARYPAIVQKRHLAAASTGDVSRSAEQAR